MDADQYIATESGPVVKPKNTEISAKNCSWLPLQPTLAVESGPTTFTFVPWRRSRQIMQVQLPVVFVVLQVRVFF
jgi:hypothetical protein